MFYQIYPRSFADGNGDGIGDLIGVRERLDYLQRARRRRDVAQRRSTARRWPTAATTSPTRCDVDPMFGTLADFDALSPRRTPAASGSRSTSSRTTSPTSTRGSRQALAAGPGHRRSGRGSSSATGRARDGELPPNNWPSVFGGPAWTRVPDGQWYLHLFAPEQPDLTGPTPRCAAEFERILRFWLDRGVDGFRIDVAHGMAKPAGLPDMGLTTSAGPDTSHMPERDDLRWDQRRRARATTGCSGGVLDSYPGDRMAVGEVWVADDERLARYVRPDELHLAFNFQLVAGARGAADEFRTRSTDSMAAMAGGGRAVHLGALQP